MTLTVPLTQGKVAIIDAEDGDRVLAHKWHVLKSKNTFYAARHGKIAKGKRQYVYMHRRILGLKKGKYCDHRNGNGLDNRRSNLRKCTKSENGGNTHARLGGSSRYKGIYWDKTRNKWVAQIKINNKRMYLGYSDNEIEATRIYNLAALKYFKQFANLNNLP